MSLIGYVRVSTVDQATDLQVDALNGIGCERIFSDELSGSTTCRPGLDDAFDYLRAGDTLCVWKLDRLGRSLKHLIEVVNDLHSKGIGFRSVTEQIDTSTNGGKLIFHVFGALAEFERGIIRERVNAGLAAARSRGRIGGRPTVVTDTKATAITALTAQGLTSAEICKSLDISRATYFRHKSQN
jgi:DNA invertase Pin-like site-specific DNA recombinase